MGRKIFVSYKYADENVRSVMNKYEGGFPKVTTARKYVDILEDRIGRDNIYKGEKDGTDLSSLSDDSIWNNLKYKIFDSSITVVLISPGMKEWYKDEKEQWIPQEISYSLKSISHENRTSQPNGIVCVVLPDRSGKYDYYINNNYYGISYNYYKTFDIIRNNCNNKKRGNGSYIVTVNWDDFIKDIDMYIEKAANNQENIEDYDITKII